MLQQHTLSIRISEAVRNSLARTRELIFNHHRKSAATSDGAKRPPQSATDDRSDEHLEIGDLLARPTEALCAIRRKWERNQDLSRAEWVLLAHFVEIGCEDGTEAALWPSRESFAQALEALLAVRALRVGHDMDVELDRYYLQRLAASAPLGQLDREDPDMIPQAVALLIHELRQSAAPCRPMYVGRCVLLALSDEDLEGIASLNRALFPYLPVLYGLAARGHYLREHCPVRTESIRDRLCPFFKCVIGADHCISVVVTDDGELEMLIDMSRKQVACPLGHYPSIRELGSMLERLEGGRLWNGRDFLGYSGTAIGDQGKWFQDRKSGVSFALAPVEWQSLREVFQQALALPELQPVLAELSLTYGEI
jgi:hypothetical protein